MELADYTDCRIANKTYEGNAGRKFGVHADGELWLLKFPGAARGTSDAGTSNATGPISEYIGSHVYEALGIPVHETRLGTYDGRIVVACKDFTYRRGIINSFHGYKNRLTDDVVPFEEQSASPGTRLEFDEVVAVVENSMLSEIPGLVERFWDMFVVDAFIANNDRNNTNWGCLLTFDDQVVLAPVFDNGNSFDNKKSDEDFAKILGDPDSLVEHSITDVRSRYTVNGRPIFPYELMYDNMAGDGKYSTQIAGALGRFAKRMDIAGIIAMIDEIPVSWQGVKVASEGQKGVYRKLLECRWDFMQRIASPHPQKPSYRAFAEEVKNACRLSQGKAPKQPALSPGRPDADRAEARRAAGALAIRHAAETQARSGKVL